MRVVKEMEVKKRKGEKAKRTAEGTKRKEKQDKRGRREEEEEYGIYWREKGKWILFLKNSIQI